MGSTKRALSSAVRHESTVVAATYTQIDRACLHVLSKWSDRFPGVFRFCQDVEDKVDRCFELASGDNFAIVRKVYHCGRYVESFSARLPSVEAWYSKIQSQSSNVEREHVKYICLIYIPTDVAASQEELQKAAYAYQVLNEKLDAEIDYRARFYESSTAKTLRIRDGKRQLTDGPFSQQAALAGFYVFNCASQDEALEYAAQIPSVHFGAIEVRQMVEDWSPERERKKF